MKLVILASVLHNVAALIWPDVSDYALLVLRILVSETTIFPAIFALPFGVLCIGAEQLSVLVNFLRRNTHSILFASDFGGPDPPLFVVGDRRPSDPFPIF